MQVPSHSIKISKWLLIMDGSRNHGNYLLLAAQVKISFAFAFSTMKPIEGYFLNVIFLERNKGYHLENHNSVLPN